MGNNLDAGKNRRRSYYINRKFQRDFILKFCLLVIVGAVVFGGILYFTSKSTVTTTFINSRLRIISTADYILPAILLSSVIVIILTGIATIGVTLFTSHRIVGPLYRIEKDVMEVATGNLAKKIKLRQTDEIKSLAESINVMVDMIRGDIHAVKNVVYDLNGRVKDHKALEDLKDMNDILDKYRT